MREKRFEATLVVAGLLKDPHRGEILLVDRGEYLTLPTGHMDPDRDNTLEETLDREMKEELEGLRSLDIVESLGSLIRNKSSPPKSIEIFSCNVRKNEIKSYKEGTIIIWMRASEALKLPYLDRLAETALERYTKKYPRKKEEEKDEETRGNFSEAPKEEVLCSG